MRGKREPERAVIHVPRTIEPAERYQSMVQCMDHLQRHDYVFAGLLTGDYTEISQMVGAGLVDIVLVAREDHLPPNRIPRIEVAVLPKPQPPDRRGLHRQRTRFIRRAEAA